MKDRNGTDLKIGDPALYKRGGFTFFVTVLGEHGDGECVVDVRRDATGTEPTRYPEIVSAMRDADDALRSEDIEPHASFTVAFADLEYVGDGPGYV